MEWSERERTENECGEGVLLLVGFWTWFFFHSALGKFLDSSFRVVRQLFASSDLGFFCVSVDLVFVLSAKR